MLLWHSLRFPQFLPWLDRLVCLLSPWCFYFFNLCLLQVRQYTVLPLWLLDTTEKLTVITFLTCGGTVGRFTLHKNRKSLYVWRKAIELLSLFFRCNTNWKHCRLLWDFLALKVLFKGSDCNNDDTRGNKPCPWRQTFVLCCGYGVCTLFFLLFFFFPLLPYVQLLYSRLAPLPHPITLYVLRIGHSPEAEQAPPLATAARLVALSQVIWGKWATQRR